MPTPPTFATIDPLADQQALVAYYEGLTGAALHPAAVERLMLNAIAYRYSLALATIQDAACQNLVDFARAPALDYLGIYVGVTRLAAGPASVEVEFTLNAGHGGVTIPAGTRIATADGQVVFQTTAGINVASFNTTCTGTAEAQTDGESGNGYAIGTLTSILDPQAYLVSVTNTATTAGGNDTETDDALRVRIKQAPASFSTAGSRQAYRYHALTASALISDVGVILDTITPGQINIYPLMASGITTPAGIISAVEDACNAETVRPLSDTIAVAAPTRVDYTVDIEVTLYTGFDYVTAQDAIRVAIQAWGDARRQLLGIDITDTQIIAVAFNAVPGQIYDLVFNTWTDVVIAADEFGNLDSLSVIIVGDTAG